jgi:hypothetical protein
MAADGFLSRWSRRKQDVREGKPIEGEPTEGEPNAQAAVPEPALAPASAPVPIAAAPEPTPPPPTLEDVESLTFESDFKRFVAAGVDPQVKTAAVKKLFADPRYNVRDSMDVYADDYSVPDPLPESMLRKLAIGQALKLFEETVDDGAAQSVAQSQPHADPDLRLQQDDAPAGEDAGDAGAHDAVPPRGGNVPEGGAG